MDWGSRQIRDALWTRLTAPHSIVALIVDDAWTPEHVHAFARANGEAASRQGSNW